MDYYLYRFLSKDEVIYLGKTTDIARRMYIHFNKGHLPLECYDQVEKIQYIKCKNNTEMNLKEIYFINKYKPIYNSLLKSECDEISLKEFDDIPWIKEYKIEKHKNVEDHYESIIAKLNDEIDRLKCESTKYHVAYIKLLDSSSRENYLVRKYKEILNMVDDNSIQAKVRGIEKDPYWKQR